MCVALVCVCVREAEPNREPVTCEGPSPRPARKRVLPFAPYPRSAEGKLELTIETVGETRASLQSRGKEGMPSASREGGAHRLVTSEVSLFLPPVNCEVILACHTGCQRCPRLRNHESRAQQMLTVCKQEKGKRKGCRNCITDSLSRVHFCCHYER